MRKFTRIGQALSTSAIFLQPLRRQYHQRPGPMAIDKVICLGKNYLAHAKELGDAIPEKPVIFLKPPSAIFNATSSPNEVHLPKNRGSIHHELEIVLRLGVNSQTGSGVITAATLGLDLTLRDVQGILKKNGHPWEIGKVFASAAIVGPFIPLSEVPLEKLMQDKFTLHVDGKLRQSGAGLSMTMKPQEAIEYVSQYFPICDGDLLFTGTPEGVGPLLPGQTAELSWDNHLSYTVSFM